MGGSDDTSERAWGEGDALVERVFRSLVETRVAIAEGKEDAIWAMVGTLAQMVAEDGEGRKALRERFGLPPNSPSATLGNRVATVMATQLVVAGSEGSETGVEGGGEGRVEAGGEGEGSEGVEGEGEKNDELTTMELVAEMELLREDVEKFAGDLQDAILDEVKKEIAEAWLTLKSEMGKKVEGETKERKERKGKGKGRGKGKGKDKGKEPVSSESEEDDESETSSSGSSSSSSDSTTASDDESTSSEDSGGESSSEKKRKGKGKGKKPGWAGKKAKSMRTWELLEAGANLIKWLKKKKKTMGARSKAELKALRGMWPALQDALTSRWKKKRRRGRKALRSAVSRMQDLGKVVLKIKVDRVDEQEIAYLFGKDAAKEVKAREKTANPGGGGNKGGRNGSGNKPFRAGNGNRGGQGSNGFRGQQGGFGGGGFRGNCHRCNGWGHRASQCPKPKECYACGSTRHLANSCPQNN